MIRAFSFVLHVRYLPFCWESSGVAAAWLALERGVNWQNLQLIIVLKNLTLLNIKHEQLVDDSGVSPRFDWQHISKAVTPENSFSLVPTYLDFFFLSYESVINRPEICCCQAQRPQRGTISSHGFLCEERLIVRHLSAILWNLSQFSAFTLFLSDAAWFKRKLLISAFKYRAICCTVHRSSLMFVDCFWIKFCRWYHVHLTDFLTAAHSERSKKHLNLQDLVFNSPYLPLYILFKLRQESLLSRQ